MITLPVERCFILHLHPVFSFLSLALLTSRTEWNGNASFLFLRVGGKCPLFCEVGGGFYIRLKKFLPIYGFLRFYKKSEMDI